MTQEEVNSIGADLRPVLNSLDDVLCIRVKNRGRLCTDAALLHELRRMSPREIFRALTGEESTDGR